MTFIDLFLMRRENTFSSNSMEQLGEYIIAVIFESVGRYTARKDSKIITEFLRCYSSGYFSQF